MCFYKLVNMLPDFRYPLYNLQRGQSTLKTFPHSFILMFDGSPIFLESLSNPHQISHNFRKSLSSHHQILLTFPQIIAKSPSNISQLFQVVVELLQVITFSKLLLSHSQNMVKSLSNISYLSQVIVKCIIRDFSSY